MIKIRNNNNTVIFKKGSKFKMEFKWQVECTHGNCEKRGSCFRNYNHCFHKGSAHIWTYRKRVVEEWMGWDGIMKKHQASRIYLNFRLDCLFSETDQNVHLSGYKIDLISHIFLYFFFQGYIARWQSSMKHARQKASVHWGGCRIIWSGRPTHMSFIGHY